MTKVSSIRRVDCIAILHGSLISLCSRYLSYFLEYFPRILLISAVHLTQILNKCEYYSRANTEALAHADCTHGAQFFSVWSSSLSRPAKRSVSKPLSLPAFIPGGLRGSISTDPTLLRSNIPRIRSSAKTIRGRVLIHSL